jgi:putative ABC transport system permease protein
VILSRPVYQRWWQDRSVNRFHVTLAPGAAVDAVRRTIASDLGAEQGLKVLTQRELYDYHREAVRRAFRLTKALELLPLVVAGLGLAEALLAVSLDRRREFALLRTGGATRTQVARAVLGESLGVGVLGLAGGLGIGAVLAVLWVRANFTHQLGWEIDLHFAAGSIPAAAVAALLVSGLAGLLPARRVVRLPVLEALRQG